jgi:hypothetical protein
MTLNFTIDDSGDQEARDHEKNIDPDESTPESLGEGVEEDDRQNRERPQTINVLPIATRPFQADTSDEGGSRSLT